MNRTLLAIIFLLPILSFGQDSIQSIILDSLSATTETISLPVIGHNNEQPTNINIENKIPEPSTDYVSALISIFSLIIGFLLNKWYENYTLKKKINSEGTQWIQNLIQLQDPLGEQISILENYIPLNDENHWNMSDMSYSVSLDCDEFNTLDSKSLVPYLLQANKKTGQKESIILAGKIKRLIKVIETTSSNFKNEFKVLTSSSQPFMSEFHLKFNDFRVSSIKYLDHAFQQYAEGTSKYSAAIRIKALFQNKINPTIESGEIDLFALDTEFVKPFIKEAFEDRQNELMQEALSLLNLFDRNIKAVKMERKYFRIRLETHLASFKSQRDSLEKILVDKSFPIT